MRVRLILCLTLVQLLLSAGEAKHKPKPALLEISDFKAQHTGETISFEGRVRNSGETPARLVTLHFALIAPDDSIVARRSGALDETELGPGAETAFAFEMPWTPRAVSVKIEAKGPQSNDIKLSGEGPHKIE